MARPTGLEPATLGLEGRCYPNELRALAEIAALENKNKERDYALSTFMGFYFANFKTRKEYCQRLGVDISTFTGEFNRLHQEELGLARKYVFKTKEMENKVYGMIKNGLEKGIEIDINDMATVFSVTHADACQILSDDGVAVAQEMLFRDVQPEIYHVISALKPLYNGL